MNVGFNTCGNSEAGVRVKTLGWEPVCDCANTDELSSGDGVVPCTVLDPFIGSGTTCCVSLKHGRRSIGIDLSADYLRNCAKIRIEGELLSLRRTDLIGKQAKVVKTNGEVLH
jgi:hypothetical protein